MRAQTQKHHSALPNGYSQTPVEHVIDDAKYINRQYKRKSGQNVVKEVKRGHKQLQRESVRRRIEIPQDGDSYTSMLGSLRGG